MGIIQSSRNSISTASNPYQGDARKVLCVCSAGCLRSPTLANVLHREYGYNTRSAGSCESFAIVPVSDVLLHWADEIVFVNVENYKETFGGQKLEDIMYMYDISEVKVLKVPDNYDYMDKTLQRLLIEEYEAAQPIECDGELIERF